MATLGCAQRYDAVIHWQGGRQVFAHLDSVTEVSWARKLDDYSEASVTLAKRRLSAQCWEQIAPRYNDDGTVARPGIEPWAHELSIYRDGYLVWQGPVVEWTETRDAFEIYARDVLAWMDRRVININFEAPPDANPDDSIEEKFRGETGAILNQIFTDTWPGTHETHPWDNPGISEHARIDPTPGRFTETETIWKGSRTVGDLVREIIGNGIDLFTLGRRVYAIPDYAASNLDRAPYRLTENHVQGDIEVRKLGLELATEGFVVSQPQGGGNNSWPVHGKWPPDEGVGGPTNPATPAYFGRVTRFHEAQSLSGPAPEPPPPGAPPPPPPQNPAPALVDVARAIREYGFPCPMAIVLPSQASLTPQAPVSIGQLVPGRVFSVELTSYVAKIADLFRLNELQVTWNGGSGDSGGGGSSASSGSGSDSGGGSTGPEQVQVSLVSLRTPPVPADSGASSGGAA